MNMENKLLVFKALIRSLEVGHKEDSIRKQKRSNHQVVKTADSILEYIPMVTDSKVFGCVREITERQKNIHRKISEGHQET